MSEALRPFRIEVGDPALADLRQRIAAFPWGLHPDDEKGGYGVATSMVRALAEHWLLSYDWRSWEARLNRLAQYTTIIDGTKLHFIHVRSPEANALPLILSHGWPGSVVEFLDLVGPLSDPVAFGLDPRLAFDLVIPSLPGAGWSGRTPDDGWGPARIAGAWAELMQTLGYQRFGAVGNDWGSHISLDLARTATDALVGAHVTQLPSLPDGESPYVAPTIDPPEFAELSSLEQSYLGGLRFFQNNLGAYQHVHAQQPQTLAYALSDSPVGLLAWAAQVMGGLDAEVLLTHVSIQWLTGTAGSALRIYADHERQPRVCEPTRVPVGLAQFARDAKGIRRYAERDHTNIVSWNEYETAGHYAAHEAPELLIADIREFFGPLR
jgi:pimeloyl-ACP methyl ester carboxylesterase